MKLYQAEYSNGECYELDEYRSIFIYDSYEKAKQEIVENGYEKERKDCYNGEICYVNEFNDYIARVIEIELLDKYEGQCIYGME